jgi:hypothetical protein
MFLGSVVARKHRLVRLLSVGCSGKPSWSSSMGAFRLVDWMFFLQLSKCPIVVASSGGGCFLRVASVRPAKGGRNPFFMAFSNVLIAGEYMAAW